MNQPAQAPPRYQYVDRPEVPEAFANFDASSCSMREKISLLQFLDAAKECRFGLAVRTSRPDPGLLRLVQLNLCFLARVEADHFIDLGSCHRHNCCKLQFRSLKLPPVTLVIAQPERASSCLSLQ
jgi:hypothetical protein